jgi:hypothetical protein
VLTKLLGSLGARENDGVRVVAYRSTIFRTYCQDAVVVAFTSGAESNWT